jgi:hypothetical protein
MRALPNINLESIEKIYKLLPHHEVFPLVLRIKSKGDRFTDIDTDNHGFQAVEDTEDWLRFNGFTIEEVDLSLEDISGD